MTQWRRYGGLEGLSPPPPLILDNIDTNKPSKALNGLRFRMCLPKSEPCEKHLFNIIIIVYGVNSNLQLMY